ncbi:MAG TPA: creatininase family protein [Planctomycetota bacterium]|nr:creatininase family protein [Planctomycetota bacterium]
MTQEVRWERMFPDQLEAAFVAKPLVWFAYGLCEPHGPQNTLGLDALKAHALCVRAAEAHGGIVAPPDYWHIHEIGHYAVWAHANVGEGRTWLSCVPPWVHFKNVLYHLRMAEVHGFHAAVLVTGHYGPNYRDLKKLVEYWQPHFALKFYGLPDFEANLNQQADHAGYVETSQLWALEPACVDITRLPQPPAPKPNFATGGDAYKANRRDGEKMIAYQVDWLGKKAAELLGAYSPSAGTRKPKSYADVEALWAKTQADLLPKLESMQELLGKDEPVPEISRWHLNFHVPKL